MVLRSGSFCHGATVIACGFDAPLKKLLPSAANTARWADRTKSGWLSHRKFKRSDGKMSYTPSHDKRRHRAFAGRIACSSGFRRTRSTTPAPRNGRRGSISPPRTGSPSCRGSARASSTISPSWCRARSDRYYQIPFGTALVGGHRLLLHGSRHRRCRDQARRGRGRALLLLHPRADPQGAAAGRGACSTPTCRLPAR